jgi:hypothetical protein
LGRLLFKGLIPSEQPADGSPNLQDSPASNPLSILFGKYLKQKVEKEYEIYFKNLLQEAKQNFNSKNAEAYQEKANIREVVNLKVGLEFIKQ